MKVLNRTVGLVCALVTVAALTAQAGLVMSSTVKSDGKDKAAQMQNAVMTISVQGKGMRMDYVESKNPSFKKGDYMVSNDGGETFYIVQTKDKSYMQFDMSMAGGMMSMMNMKASNAKSELLLDESGPKMLGYPTRHTKVRLSYTMEMSFMGMKQKNDVLQEMETWSTTKIDASALEAWAKNFAGRMGNKELDELMKASMKHSKGVPLKMINVMNNTDKNGNKTTQTTINEVTEIKEQTLSAKIFEIPEGYKNVMEEMQKAQEDNRGGSEGSGSSEESAPKKKGPSLSDMMKLLR